MGVLASIFTFLIVWWIVLFAVLPQGVRQTDAQTLGHMPGAPDKPDFKKIILRTTITSVIIWAIIFAIAQSDLISFRDMARGL